MLSSYDLAILEGICETSRALRPRDWHAVTIYDDGELMTSLTEDYNYVKITLRGPRKRQFDDWLAACADRCEPADQPRSKRRLPHLDDQIILPALSDKAIGQEHL
ncbi:MAG TPA: hypothetical protein VFH06_05765 [Candidatus Saccharimonadales bacterium]|nr:hypothetical protein [Candidatus Saccharimonadales bacterium]